MSPGAESQRLLEQLRRLDGMLVEIVVLDADVKKWGMFILNMEARGRIESFTLNGIDISSKVYAEAFKDAKADDANYRLAISVAGLSWTSALYDEHVIDAQCDAREVLTLSQVAETVDFMQTVADVLETRVALIPEYTDPRHATPLVTVQPAGS